MKENNNISRRNFLRTASLASLGLMVAGCASDGGKEQSAASAPRRKGAMTYRVNHNTGDTVSVLGFGFMRLPSVNGRAAANDDSPLDQEEINRMVDEAIANGVNYFDTSPAYCRGLSEAALGEALKRHPRDKVFIATKLSNFDPSQHSHEESVAMFNRSLQYLQTDYIDYYLLHVVGSGSFKGLHDRFLDNGMMDFCKEQRAKGTIRNLGFSYHGDVDCFLDFLERHDRGEVHWDFVQIQLNYVNWEHPAEPSDRNITAEFLYNELAKRDIPVVIMEPLLGGALAKVPKPVAAKMAQRRPEESVASWAFRFAAQPKVLTVLSGMTYMDHLRDNLATYSPLEPVTAEDHEFLMRCATEIVENKSVPCTSCAYCMPCPYGIDIPATFRHYNTALNDDLVLDGRDPRYAEARRQFLQGYDKAVDPLRQADMCIGCGKCVSHCPQGIKIPAELARINDYVQGRRNKIS